MLRGSKHLINQISMLLDSAQAHLDQVLNGLAELEDPRVEGPQDTASDGTSMDEKLPGQPESKGNQRVRGFW